MCCCRNVGSVRCFTTAITARRTQHRHGSNTTHTRCTHDLVSVYDARDNIEHENVFAWVSLLTYAKLTDRLAWVSSAMLSYRVAKCRRTGLLETAVRSPLACYRKDEPTRVLFVQPNAGIRDSLMEQMTGFAFTRPIDTISSCVARVKAIAAHPVCPLLPSPRYSLRTEVDYPRVSGGLNTSSTKHCSAKKTRFCPIPYFRPCMGS